MHLRGLDEFFSNEEWAKLTKANIVDKRGFVLSRKTEYEIFYTGPRDMHATWLGYMKQCCILHKFQRKYTVIKRIGKGSRSMIDQVCCLEDGKVYAVKDFDKDDIVYTLDDDNEKIVRIFKTIENEINIMRLLDNKNTIKLYEVYESKRHIRLVFEMLSGGDLFNKVTNPNFRSFKENECKFITRQILSALSYLHEKKIMHRDIKPENILFTNSEDLTLKVGDFGLCELTNKKGLLLLKCGTPGYLAPEVMIEEKYDEKCDLFGLGVILFMMYIFSYLNEIYIL